MNVCVIGLCYGDEGKGGIVDYLTRQLNSKLTVRFSGGPQASHHVVLPDGRWHGFSQWGAGTFAGAKTYLASNMMIEPYAMFNECAALKEKGIVDPWALLTIDPECRVITPWHWKLNRLRELLRGKKRHGSCGMGIGEARHDELTFQDPLLAIDLGRWDVLDRIRARLLQQAYVLHGYNGLTYMDVDNDTTERVCAAHAMMRESMTISRVDVTKQENVIFEGSQGMLLDESIGTAPHNTWSDLKPQQAMTLQPDLHVVGVVPTIWSRHGAGPFPTEFKEPQPAFYNHNHQNPWQGAVRYGGFDYDALNKMSATVSIDSIALTKLDIPTSINEARINGIRPISIRSFGPTYLDKQGVQSALEVAHGSHK